jgi:hypothetical protein
MEESGRGLIEVLSQHFPRDTEENHKKKSQPQSFEPSALRIHI